MANKPTTSSSSDPAALAFSAVESALKDSVFSTPEPEKPTKSQAKPSKPERPAPSERLRAADKIAAQTGSIANDDRFSSSRILYSLQSRPSSFPMWVALALSAVWIAGTGAIAWLRFGSQLSAPDSAATFITSVEFAAFVAILVLPVLGFFAVAVLVRRAQDLRIAATSMTQAAMRLAEPEAIAAEKVATVGQAVRREVNALGDGLERALSRAGELEVMVHNEVTSLERTYSENETRLRSLIQELANQRDSVITNADRVRDAIAEAHGLMVTDMERIGNNLSGTIIDRSDEVKLSIETAASSLQSALVDRTDSFVALVDNRTSDLLTSIDGSADRLNDTLSGHSESLTKAFDDSTLNLSSSIEARMSDLTAELDSRAINISTTIDDKTASLASALKSNGNAMISELEDRGYAMSGALEAIGTRITTDIGSRTTHAEDTLTNLINRLDETMSIRLNSVESKFQSALIEIDGVIEETTEKARVTVSGAGTNTLSSISARVDEVSVILDARLQQVDAVVGEKGERLINALDSHNVDFANRATSLETSLEERSRQIGDTIASKADYLNETLENQGARLGTTLDEQSMLLQAALDEKTGTLDKTIQTRTSEFSETIDSKTGLLGESIGGHTREFAEKIATRTQQLSEAISVRTKEFGDALGMRTQKLSDTLANETENLASTLDTRTDAISETISTRTAQLAQTIDGEGDAIRVRVDESMRALSESMDSRTTEMSTAITGKIAEVNDSIGREVDSAVNRLADAESGVTARLDSAANAISESARRSAETIEFGVEHARTAITDMVDKRLGTLPEAITARADITADRLTALNEAMNTTISQSMTDLEAGADRIEETITSRISQATASISTDVEQTTARMDVAVRTALEQIKTAARHIEDLVEVKAVDSAELIAGKLDTMNQTLESETANYARLIDEKSQQLEGSLRNHGNILRQALTENTEESEALMAASSQRIVTDVNEALKKLNDSNLLLQRVLETSTSNLANLENSVAAQTANYAATVKDALGTTEQAGKLVGEHVTAFQSTISGVMSEFTTMMGDLDKQSLNIDKAAHSLQDAGNFSIDTLENRRGAMEALAESFTARADDIDERMRTFAQSIAETVNDTENRLINARHAMQEALGATTDTVADQLDAFTRTAGTEGSRASEALRNTQRELLADMQNALEEATRRFNDTADAMRATATQVGGELEATRSELQRGVLELPEETRASAAAMRRVVAEQIEALNELNNIVRAQPGTHDLSTRRQPRPAPRHEPEVQRQEPARQAYQPQETATLAPPARQAAPAPARRPEPAAAPVQRPAPSNNAGSESNAGWLRDVLRNASANQQAAAPQQRGLNLSNLTDDIARAIEDSALSEAWQRYQAGESNVFSRRIYTLTGQGTYDDVRKKLQRDGDFMETATAYMSEFEQLLQNAVTGSNAARETRDLLLSDRGKVYTMLAHASGRLN